MVERKIDGVKQELGAWPPRTWNRHQETYSRDLLAAVSDDVEFKITTDAETAVKSLGEWIVCGEAQALTARVRFTVSSELHGPR